MPVTTPYHQGSISACTFAGHDQIATGSAEGRIRFWDWQQARPTGSLDAHVGPVFALAWDAARQNLISAGRDGHVLAHSRDGRRRFSLTGHRGGVHALAQSPDGSWLASGGYDGTIRIWRLEDGSAVCALAAHQAAVTCLDFLGDGRLVSGARDDVIRVWDIAARRPLAIMRGHERWVTRVCSIGDVVVSVSEDQTARAWDTRTGRELWRHFPDVPTPIWGLARSGEGRAIVLGRGGFTELCTLSADGIKKKQLLTNATARAIAADGDRVVLGTDNDGILFFDGGRQRGRIDTQACGALSLACGRDRRTGALRTLIGRVNGGVELDDGVARRKLAPAHGNFAFVSESIGPEIFATGAFDCTVRLWRMSDGAPLGVLAHGGFIFSLSGNTDGSRLLAAGGGLLSLWDTASARELCRILVPELGFHESAALSADGRIVTAVGEGRILHRWSLSPAGTEIVGETQVPLDARLFTGIRLLAGENAAVVATANGDVLRVDLESGHAVRLHAGNESYVRELCLSPDGRFVLSVGEMGAVFDLAESRLVTPPDMSRCVVPAAAFAPTGEPVFIDGLDKLHVIALPRAGRV